MQLRFLAFLPFSTAIAFMLLAGASSLVSALERSILVEPPPPASVHAISWVETECDRLFREAHALLHEATQCEAQPVCEGSPLLCPAAMDRSVTSEYERVRASLHGKCGVPVGLMDFAWGGPHGEGPVCGDSPHWEATVTGEGAPESFVF